MAARETKAARIQSTEKDYRKSQNPRLRIATSGLSGSTTSPPQARPKFRTYRFCISSRTMMKQIIDKPSHDELVNNAATGTPLVLYVSASYIPRCKQFMPVFERLAEKHSEIVFAQMEMTAATTPMIKFAPHNAPIVILMKGNDCRTLLGAEVNRLEGAMKEVFGA